MKTNQPCTNIGQVALIVVAGLVSASCSEKSRPDREKNADGSSRELVRESQTEKEGEAERRPDKDQIAEDCAAFVRATKVVSAGTPRTDCPACPAEGTDVFSFRHMKTDRISCSGDTCTVVVTIFSVFNPGSGQSFSGGLTAWIPPEQRTAYLSGQTPTGEQTFRVQITYKRHGEAWQAVEFDRGPGE